MMSELKCKRCRSADFVKSGFVRGKQRYQCRRCKCNFTAPNQKKQDVSDAVKAQCVLLYGMGNASFRMLGRLWAVSHTSVLNWVRKTALHLPEPAIEAGKDCVVILDEMHHFIHSKRRKLWLWRAYDPKARRTFAWQLGGRDDGTLRKLVAKLGVKGRLFFTDDWDGHHRVIPEDQLYTGKDLTVPLERDNSDVRHYLARFRRRTKVVSRCEIMIDLSLRLLYNLRQPETYQQVAAKFRSVFRNQATAANQLTA